MNNPIRLSCNILYAVVNILKNIKKLDLLTEEEIWDINSSQINTAWIIQTIKQCGWITEVDSNQILLTDQGNRIVNENCNTKKVMRIMLSDYILSFCPVWSYRIPYGRLEATYIMTKDERACFHEAGLLSDFPDDETVKWWDSLSTTIRKLQDVNKSDCGRTGERLTLAYEEKRTGIKPKWISIDTNLAGYDVLSQLSSEDSSNLLIEVKASKSDLKSAVCHITVNEWKIASTAKNYMFYLWVIGSTNMLATIETLQIAPYIPTNNLSGEWESVQIPFVCFKDLFQIIST